MICKVIYKVCGTMVCGTMVCGTMVVYGTIKLRLIGFTLNFVVPWNHGDEESSLELSLSPWFHGTTKFRVNPINLSTTHGYFP